MGACSSSSSASSKQPLSSDPATYPSDAFVIRIDRAARVPAMDRALGDVDAYVKVSSKRLLGRTPAAKSAASSEGSEEEDQDDNDHHHHFDNSSGNPEWWHVLDVTGARLDGEIEFDLWDRDLVSVNDHRVGFARISVRDLIKRPSCALLLSRPGGSADFVVSPHHGHLPCELHISVVKTPVGWPQPERSDHLYKHQSKHRFAKHCMIITRGTRGDVQPYCALARGLANQRNWMVTICTEMRYKDFVLSMNRGLEQGAVRFRPSGGDTHTRIDQPIAKWAMKHESELMQLAMLARTEREFFQSEPAMFYWCDKLQPDFLVYGFTMVNIAMILSEVFHIPCCGFVLQPCSLPSKHYPPVAAIDQHFISYVASQEKAESNHAFLQTFKRWMEDDPIWKPLSAMRERRGLRPFKGNKSETFSLLFANNAPVVIPINEVAFGGRPSDWPESIQMTDFIFLQGGAVLPTLSAELCKFIDDAHLAGEPVVVMTFSSMPVSRQTIVLSALAIAYESKSKPRVIALSGAKIKDKFSQASTGRKLDKAIQAGKVLELEGAPFGLLFSKVDAAVIHGGLGTTGDAMRAGIPASVAGTLLMDQRFWGKQCEVLGVGGKMVHIAHWRKQCVGVVDDLLLNQEYRTNAEALALRMQPKLPVEDGGVTENVNAVVAALEHAKPINSHTTGSGSGSTLSAFDSSRRRSSLSDVENILKYATQAVIRRTISRDSSNLKNNRFSLVPVRIPMDVPSDDKQEFLE